jgi:hypothetical protein
LLLILSVALAVAQEDQSRHKHEVAGLGSEFFDLLQRLGAKADFAAE